MGWNITNFDATGLVKDAPEPASGIDMSIVPADRRTTWNPGIYGGIPPDDATLGVFPNGVGPAIQHGPTLSPGDDIGAALSAAGSSATKASRRFVQLGAGTFNISSGLTIPSYVILRGTLGANNARQTIINETASGVIPITISGTSGTGWGTLYQVQGTLKRGDDTITLDTTAGLNVGDVIKLDQYNDGDRSGKNKLIWDITGGGAKVTTTNISKDWDDTPTQTDACVFGNSALSQTRADYNDSNFKGQSYPDSPGEGGDTDRGWRHMSETKEILEINGNTIRVFTPVINDAQTPNATISGSPVHMWYYRSPEVYRVCGDTGTETEYAGVEDLSIWPFSNPGVLALRTKFCWLKNVEVTADPAIIGRTMAKDNLVRVLQFCYRFEVKSCYIHDQPEYSPGGGYGLTVRGGECYIHDNVVRNHNKCINMEASAGGNVVAYNFVDNAVINSSNSWNESGIGTHASFCHTDLYEGNDTNNITNDSTHGNNGFNVAFRNHCRGYNTFVDGPPGYTFTVNPSLSRAIMVDFMCWEFTSIGNVMYSPTVLATNIETSGHGTNWFQAIQRESVYLMGHNGWTSTGITNECVDDNFAGSNMHYHMDYHYFDQGNNLSINGGNPVTDLPDSLHRTIAPDYFSGFTWPPIDPTQSTFASQVTTLPAKSRADAGTM